MDSSSYSESERRGGNRAYPIWISGANATLPAAAGQLTRGAFAGVGGFSEYSRHEHRDEELGERYDKVS
jgi:hypothetical protein